MKRAFKFISLFRSLFGPSEKLSTQSIERKGLLAVKIAQMYAVRSDLLSSETCAKLRSLFETTSPIPWETVESVLQKSATPEFHQRLQTIDQTPLATASLGQVHRATLNSGEQVVVKIIKPQAQASFEKDLRTVKRLAQCAIIFYPKLKRLADPIGTIETIARLTRTELDLRNESRGTLQLQELRDKRPDLSHLHALHFPKIYADLTSSEVLVSEYIEHKSVSRGLEDGSFTYQHLLHLFRIQGYFLFLNAKFHGDLHPGNVFFHNEEFWFLDNAYIEETDLTFSKGLLKFLGELGEGDYSSAAQTMENLSLSPPKDASQYYERFTKLYEGFESGTSSLTNQMMETVKLCVHSGMEFPQGAFPIIKSLMYLDGMALKCAPEAKLLDDVLAYTVTDRETPS